MTHGDRGIYYIVFSTTKRNEVYKCLGRGKVGLYAANILIGTDDNQ
jgi:hypothetical protein